MSGSRWFIITLVCALAITSCHRAFSKNQSEANAALVLDIVYPRLEGANTAVVLPRVDSTFAFGSVQPVDSRVYMNGVAARMWENGAFLVYAPLDTMQSAFLFTAISTSGDTVRQRLPFRWAGCVVSATKPPKPDPQRSLTARFTIKEDHANLRSAPDGAYTLFPPKGSTGLVDQYQAPYYRVRLTDDLHYWIEERFVQLDTLRRTPIKNVINQVKVVNDTGGVKINIPMETLGLFQLQEGTEANLLTLEIYGATSQINRIDYATSDPLVREIRWRQIEDEVLRIEVFLNVTRLWGYQAEWQDHILTLKIRRPPNFSRNVFKGRTIVLDPGHGGSQPGAVGPTRLAEKEPNLKLALELKTLLEKQGAQVFLTRSSDSTMELYDRVNFARDKQADILLSLHNNALSEGENPFLKHGSAVYYYHPQSRELAWILHQHLLQATELPDYGLYYQNLALARPTEILAVLIESAFMMYPAEEMKLRDPKFIQRIARGLTAGLQEYFKYCRSEQQGK